MNPDPPLRFEAVPNFSEGRSPETLAALAEAAGDLLLDLHHDAAHHRAVLTLAGRGGELAVASRALLRTAMERIDLRRHRGEHPRVGALDVLPVVPLGTASLEDAARLARRIGAELAATGDLPVFLYGHASPTREALPRIRRGGPAGLARRVARGEMTPDYGPGRLHPTAGAVVVGARDFLIAFNVNLEGGGLRVARRIAARIRNRPDDPRPSLRAIGVRLAAPGEVQVSMNLLDFRRTSVKEAFDRVEAEARRGGAGVRSSEIVGLIPAAATWPGMERDLGLAGPPRTVESALAAGQGRCAPLYPALVRAAT